ncbi:MAG: hypothetical protein L0H84_08185, partial [Pseudonocardia sp.]|nr:hypothetical protein [Pseudonocardia sp.]
PPPPMTRTLPLPTRTEAPPLTDLDARLRLDVAVRELTEPTVENLDRIDRALDSIAAAQAREDRDIDKGLAATHTRLLSAGHHAQAATVISRLITHRRIVAARTARQDTTIAEVPALLEQILDAVQSTGGTNRATGAGAHAAPIGLAAAELVHTIERANHAPTSTALDLTTHVRTWATNLHDGQVSGADLAEQISTAADLAEQWVQQARAILTPPKRWTHPGACPACGRNTAHVHDDSGQHVRRPALELDRANATARCLRCGARWTGEGQLRSLARVLEDQHHLT